jgi:hypothetical protein
VSDIGLWDFFPLPHCSCFHFGWTVLVQGLTSTKLCLQREEAAAHLSHSNYNKEMSVCYQQSAFSEFYIQTEGLWEPQSSSVCCRNSRIYFDALIALCHTGRDEAVTGMRTTIRLYKVQGIIVLGTS